MTAAAANPVLDDLTKRVSIRKTHPFLYRVLMLVAVIGVCSGLNLYWKKPTFLPYDIHKDIIATVFLILGIGQIVFLNLWHHLPMMRRTTAVSATFMLIWGLLNTKQAFAGKASFALPIMFVGSAALQFLTFFEPASNPLAGNGVAKQ